MTAESKIIIDSSAWIEYLEGSDIGMKVERLFESDSVFYTPNIVMLEVISKAKRKGMDFSKAKQIIQSISYAIDETQEDYFDAGVLHAEMRKSGNVSIGDALIISLAKKINAKILTKDYHQKGAGSIFLE